MERDSTMGRIIDRKGLQDFINTNKITKFDPMPASFMGVGEEYVLQDGTTYTTESGATYGEEFLPGTAVHVI